MINNQQICDDTLLWDLWLSRQQLIALAIADELNVFNAINEGCTTVSLLSESLSMDIKGTEALTCILASLGFIRKRTKDIELVDVSKNYLLLQSPFYWGAALSRARDNQEYQRVLKAFKGDKTSQLLAGEKSFSTLWSTGEIDEASARQFTSIMHCTIRKSAINAIQSGIFKGIKLLVDIGGGSGCFLNEFVSKYPNSVGTLFELDTVCKIAKNYIQKEFIDKRIILNPGNFFKDSFPKNGDGILFSNIFHDWPTGQNKILAQKSYEALPHNGKIFIHEMLLNDEKNGPLAAACFNLLMYVNHGSQQYTKSEIFDLLQDIGFNNCRVVNTHPYYSVIIGEK